VTRAGRGGAGNSDVTVSIDEAELRATLRAFDLAGKEASAALRDASLEIAGDLAGNLRRAATMSPLAPPQARLIAPTIKPKRDRIIVVSIGGPARVGRPYRSRRTGRKVRAQAGALVWGSETGSLQGTDKAGRAYTSRYVESHNPAGYWIAPTVARYGPEARERWWDAVEHLLRRLGFTVTREAA
jgi:hypothetical protein